MRASWPPVRLFPAAASACSLSPSTAILLLLHHPLYSYRSHQTTALTSKLQRFSWKNLVGEKQLRCTDSKDKDLSDFWQSGCFLLIVLILAGHEWTVTFAPILESIWLWLAYSLFACNTTGKLDVNILMLNTCCWANETQTACCGKQGTYCLYNNKHIKCSQIWHHWHQPGIAATCRCKGAWNIPWAV